MAQVRDEQREHWDTVAPGWSAWLPWTTSNFRPVTEWLRRAIPWRPGASALDTACGAGYPLLEAAAWVRPGGSFAAADVSPRMLDAAGGAARAAGFEDIEFVTADAERLPHADASFDIAINAYGLMFCDDPSRALRETHRVLRPRGSVAVVTWDDVSRSPFFSVIHRVAAPVLSLTAPAPGGPGPFRLASADVLEDLLRGAGFDPLAVESVPMTVVLKSASEYLRLFADLAWRRRIEGLSRGAYERLERDLGDALGPHTVGGEIRLTATSLCASGRKAG